MNKSMNPPILNINKSNDIKHTLQNNNNKSYIPSVQLNRSNSVNSLSDDELGLNILSNVDKIKKVDNNESNEEIKPKFPVMQPMGMFSNSNMNMNNGIDSDSDSEINMPINKNNEIGNDSDSDESVYNSINNNNNSDNSDNNSEKSELERNYYNNYRSEEDIIKEKRKLLFKLRRYEKKGYTLSRNFTINNSLDDLQTEVDTIKREINLDSSVKVSKNILISVCSIAEFLNNKFDPFDIVLDGWSEEVNEDVENNEYDEIFEELYDKYHEKVAVGPELKLLMMVGGSAVKFHLTHTVLKSVIPGAETLLKQNPGLKDQIQNLVMKNIPGMNGASNPTNLSHMLNKENKSMNRPVGTMNGPVGVDSILEEIEAGLDKEDDIEKTKKKKNIVDMSGLQF